MRARLATMTAPAAVAKPPVDQRVETIVQLLVQRAVAEPRSANYREIDGQACEVVLDLEVEGVRCVLTRPAPQLDRSQITLSPREREISRMVAKGYANKTIAAVLDISSWTVCTYLRRIFAKLGVSSRAAMVARLLEEGLLKDGPPSGMTDRPRFRQSTTET
jgi:two-component system, NarL family, nitrate/nitrite response regulator NarL